MNGLLSVIGFSTARSTSGFPSGCTPGSIQAGVNQEQQVVFGGRKRKAAGTNEGHAKRRGLGFILFFILKLEFLFYHPVNPEAGAGQCALATRFSPWIKLFFDASFFLKSKILC
mmetsp:Transcript_39592/g.78016  ORF Transcript_39592/g.78016 Transcript_39592/m.78016 type:complete len:114 (+) Transcript_39592:1796-2137(+)